MVIRRRRLRRATADAAASFLGIVSGVTYEQKNRLGEKLVKFEQGLEFSWWYCTNVLFTALVTMVM